VNNFTVIVDGLTSLTASYYALDISYPKLSVAADELLLFRKYYFALVIRLQENN